MKRETAFLSVSRLSPLPTEEDRLGRGFLLVGLVCGIIALACGAFAWFSYSSHGEWTKLSAWAYVIEIAFAAATVGFVPFGWMFKKRILSMNLLRPGDWMVKK